MGAKGIRIGQSLTDQLQNADNLQNTTHQSSTDEFTTALPNTNKKNIFTIDPYIVISDFKLFFIIISICSSSPSLKICLSNATKPFF